MIILQDSKGQWGELVLINNGSKVMIVQGKDRVTKDW